MLNVSRYSTAVSADVLSNWFLASSSLFSAPEWKLVSLQHLNVTGIFRSIIYHMELMRLLLFYPVQHMNKSTKLSQTLLGQQVRPQDSFPMELPNLKSVLFAYYKDLQLLLWHSTDVHNPVFSPDLQIKWIKAWNCFSLLKTEGEPSSCSKYSWSLSVKHWAKNPILYPSQHIVNICNWKIMQAINMALSKSTQFPWCLW